MGEKAKLVPFDDGTAEAVPVEMVEVASSNVRAVGYSVEHRALRVQFKSGATYQYAGVGEDDYREMVGAESVGKFIAKEILPKFQAVRLREARTINVVIHKDGCGKSQLLACTCGAVREPVTG